MAPAIAKAARAILESLLGKNIGRLVAGIALGLYLAFLVIALGWRSWLQYRRTRDSGFRGLSNRATAAEWIGGSAFVSGVILSGAAPLAELAGLLAPSDLLAGSWSGRVGLVLMLSGFAGTIMSQLQMGDSWRIGVADHEATPLVTAGLFGHIRNPIFSSMLLALVGLLLMVPNALSVVAFGISLLGVEIQVRCVEEPYLARTHGDRYRSYARSVGRFFPGVGRLS